MTAAPLEVPTPAPAMRAEVAQPEPVAPAVVALDYARLPWNELHEQLGVEGATRQLARQSAWVGREANVVRLSLSPEASFLLIEARRVALETALSKAFGERIELRIALRMAETAEASAHGEAESPAELDARRAQEKIKAAHASIESDPVVRAFREQFGASVRPGSVHPLDS